MARSVPRGQKRPRLKLRHEECTIQTESENMQVNRGLVANTHPLFVKRTVGGIIIHDYQVCRGGGGLNTRLGRRVRTMYLLRVISCDALYTLRCKYPQADITAELLTPYLLTVYS